MSDERTPGPRPTPRATSDHDEPSIWTDEPTAPTAPAPRPRRAERTARSKPPVLTLLATFVVGALLGAVAFAVIDPTSSDQTDDRVGSAAPATSTTAPRPTPSSSPPPTEAPSTALPVTTSTPAAPTPATPAGGDATAIATALSPMRLPSDCPLPLGEPESLPNAARDYRAGVHEGIDFICEEYGRDAIAPLDGQVVVANASFEDPKPAERKEILDIAAQVGDTPPWTLAMLFGRFVAIDHGIRPGAGHVVTIYAHLNKIDPAIVPGHHVQAGDRIGEIGNAGTESAGTGEPRARAIHLHWEIHVDGKFLGEGATAAETSKIYRVLFGR